MRNNKISVGLCAIAALCFVIWRFNSPGDAKLSLPGVASAVAQAVTGPVRVPINESCTVAAGKEQEYSFEFTKPGRLYGGWSSRGHSARVENATDDTLVSFELRGPNDELLQDADHQTGGNFDVRITSPGRYTFVLGNGGILRMSDRVVEIEAAYQSD